MRNSIWHTLSSAFLARSGTENKHWSDMDKKKPLERGFRREAW